MFKRLSTQPNVTYHRPHRETFLQAEFTHKQYFALSTLTAAIVVIVRYVTRISFVCDWRHCFIKLKNSASVDSSVAIRMCLQLRLNMRLCDSEICVFKILVHCLQDGLHIQDVFVYSTCRIVRATDGSFRQCFGYIQQGGNFRKFVIFEKNQISCISCECIQESLDFRDGQNVFWIL